MCHSQGAGNFLPHQSLDMLLKRRDIARQLLEMKVANCADAAVFERHCVAVIYSPTDRLQPNRISSHLEADGLLAPVIVHYGSLQESAVDEIEPFECGA